MLDEHLLELSRWLQAQRYTPETVKTVCQKLVHFQAFLLSRGVREVREIEPHHVEDFVEVRRKQREEEIGRTLSPTYGMKLRHSGRLLLKFLHRQGLIKGQAVNPPPETPFTAHQQAYARALKRMGNLGASAQTARLYWVRRLCDFLAARDFDSLAQLTPAILYEFLTDIAPNKAASTLGQLNVAMKDFLCFAFDQHWTSKDLSGYLLRVNTYRDQKLPNYLSRDQLEALLGRIDIHERGARKLKAIIVLLASYGLRIGEVAKLTFTNLDWSHRRFLVPDRKNNDPLILPLTPAVATAVANYILHERPRDVDCPHIFVTTQRPRPYRKGSHLAATVNSQLRRLGVRASTRTFRHSFAKSLIDQAVPLSTIQQLMGHRSIESTRIYARIDIEALREVADNDSLDL